MNLHLLYKLKTSKLFERPKPQPVNPDNSSNQETIHEPIEDPFAIEQIYFCPESRILAVAGSSSHVIVFRFSKQETHSEIPVNFYLQID